MCPRKKNISYNKPKDIPDLRKVLFEYIKNTKMEKGFYNANIINAWPEMVGEKLAGFSAPFKYADRVLFIKIESSVWRNEFHYLEKDIIKRYNDHFKSEVVIKIMVY